MPKTMAEWRKTKGDWSPCSSCGLPKNPMQVHTMGEPHIVDIPAPGERHRHLMTEQHVHDGPRWRFKLVCSFPTCDWWAWKDEWARYLADGGRDGNW